MGSSVGARAASTRPIPAPTPEAAVINVTIVSAVRAAHVLQALFAHDRVRVDPNANAVIVLAPPDDIAQMRAVIQGIDVRSPQKPQVDVVQLHVLKPAAIIDHLRELYPNARIEPASKQSLLLQATPQDMSDMKAVISGLDVAPVTPAPSTPPPADTVKVDIADPRNVARALVREVSGLHAAVSGSTVILVGSEDDIQKAKALAQAMDAPPYNAKYTQVYRLHNVDATSVADLVSRSFPNVRVTVDKDLNAISILGTSADQQRIGAAITELDSMQAANTQQGGGGPAYGDGNIDVIDLTSAMPGLNGAPSTSATDIANAVQQALQQLTPDLHITVPANSTEIILAGSPQSIRLAKDLIARLDHSRPLVVLDTEVLEVDESVARNLGLTVSSVVGSVFAEVQPTPNPSTGISRMIGLQPLTRSGISFTATLNLLVQDGNARVLADPRLTTISGNTASIRAGDSIAILTQTGGGVGTPVTQQLQTFNTGVTLDITPMVGPSGTISVALHPVVNSLSGLVNGIPQIATRDTQTVVQLQDNQTLVIGGLIQETLQHSISKIPLLGELPLVGKLFQNGVTDYQRNELIIVVTPHIVKPGEPLPAPNAVLPIPTPQPLPTLPPGTMLPQTQHFPPPHPEPAPVTAPTPHGPTLNTPVPTPTIVPAPTPTAFASTNVFMYGSPPPNTYAPDSDAAQIFFAQFSPTVLHNGTPVQVFAVTTTNVNKVTIGYPGYMVTLSQIAPSKWQGNYNFNASGLASSQNAVNLTLNAYRSDGTAATINIPVSLLTR